MAKHIDHHYIWRSKPYKHGGVVEGHTCPSCGVIMKQLFNRHVCLLCRYVEWR